MNEFQFTAEAQGRREEFHHGSTRMNADKQIGGDVTLEKRRVVLPSVLLCDSVLSFAYSAVNSANAMSYCSRLVLVGGAYIPSGVAFPACP